MIDFYDDDFEGDEEIDYYDGYESEESEEREYESERDEYYSHIDPGTVHPDADDYFENEGVED